MPVEVASAESRLVPRGAFDLGQSINFGFGPRDPGAGEVMRLAFLLEGDGLPEGAGPVRGAAALGPAVGVAVRQDPSGALHVDSTLSTAAGPISDRATLQAVSHQVARILSVDVDARGWDALGGEDPLIGRLQAARPGLRPPLFHSAYEAAAWCVLSARRPREQMAALRERLSRAHGAVIGVAGEELAVFPSPEQLLAVESFPSLPAVKLARLHGVARAALAGDLDTARLRALAPAEALTRLRRLDGIGPFYAELVVVRALGHTDVVPTSEPTVLEIAGQLTGTGRPLTVVEFAALADGWRPWRTWASVALRAAGPLLLADRAQKASA